MIQSLCHKPQVLKTELGIIIIDSWHAGMCVNASSFVGKYLPLFLWKAAISLIVFGIKLISLWPLWHFAATDIVKLMCSHIHHLTFNNFKLLQLLTRDDHQCIFSATSSDRLFQLDASHTAHFLPLTIYHSSVTFFNCHLPWKVRCLLSCSALQPTQVTPPQLTQPCRSQQSWIPSGRLSVDS